MFLNVKRIISMHIVQFLVHKWMLISVFLGHELTSPVHQYLVIGDHRKLAGVRDVFFVQYLWLRTQLIILAEQLIYWHCPEYEKNSDRLARLIGKIFLTFYHEYTMHMCRLKHVLSKKGYSFFENRLLRFMRYQIS